MDAVISAQRIGKMTRMYSLNPGYLDAKGIGGVWKEWYRGELGLLGLTKDHANHPQLDRFKAQPDPVASTGCYGLYIYDDACRRGYRYNFGLISKPTDFVPRIPVTRGQVIFEYFLLLAKLAKRGSLVEYRRLCLTPVMEVRLHPLFVLVEGVREGWEKGEL